MSDDTMNTAEESTKMSFTDKIVGILSSPGEVYAYVAKSVEEKSNWVIPFISTILITVIFTFVVFKQPAIQTEMQNVQEKAFQKQIDQGKMTQEQVDKAMEYSKPGSPMFLIFGSIGAVLVMALVLFGYSLLYWLAGKIFFKSVIGYSKILEVYGLSMLVMVITSLLTMILVVAMGTIHAAPALSMLVSDFDPTNKVHKLLAAINLFTFWQLAVVTIGLSKVWNITIMKALAVTGAVWIIWTALSTFLSFGG
jgi:hypothetical protein